MKVLVIRLSSIGDVVLATPVVRCLKSQLEGCEVHLITKKICGELLRGNPYIDRLIEYDGGDQQLAMLREQEYDCVVDIHNNHRSRRLRRGIGTRSLVYRKENIGKFMLVLFKKDIMSGRHVVERYLDAVKPLGVKDDGRGLELQMFDEGCRIDDDGRPYAVIACGAQHETKRIPPEKIALLAKQIKGNVVLVGDGNDRQRMEAVELSDNVTNLCGETSLTESAAVVAHAAVVVTSDSAMMHVAAAYQRPVLAVWGCTSPRFGFSAFRTVHEDYCVKGLRCWPCRRMGTAKCPKGHFDCMMRQKYDQIAEKVNEYL